MTPRPSLLAAALVLAALPAGARAGEFYIGEPVLADNLQIVPNYLTGVQMSGMPMPSGPDTIHLECDVHAARGETHGFSEDSWIPYLTIHYTLAKQGSGWTAKGTLLPMTAGDGPHYANNLQMDGPGTYKLTYVIDGPQHNGFLHHVDKATGVPDFWNSITESWTFSYPSKGKG